MKRFAMIITFFILVFAMAIPAHAGKIPRHMRSMTAGKARALLQQTYVVIFEGEELREELMGAGKVAGWKVVEHKIVIMELPEVSTKEVVSYNATLCQGNKRLLGVGEKHYVEKEEKGVTIERLLAKLRTRLRRIAYPQPSRTSIWH